MSGTPSETNSDTNNTVDHTLLESLFYNEMMLMEESPSLLLSVLQADGTPAVDANTLAETALLGEFGMAGQQPPSQLLGVAQPPATAAIGTAVGTSGIAEPVTPNTTTTSLVPPPLAAHSPQQQQQQQQQPSRGIKHNVLANPVVTAPTTAAATAWPPTTGPPSNPLAYGTPAGISVPSASSVPVVAAPPLNNAAAPVAVVPPSNTELAAVTAPVADPLPAIPLPSPMPAVATSTATTTDPKQRKKLESQFATLASRLGINLPDQLMQSLSSTAPASTIELPDNSGGQSDTSSVHNGSIATADTATNTLTFTPTESFEEAAPPPKVQALQTAAEAAIAAVDNKRQAAEQQNAAAAGNKRRKKPRLVDCERKLASLQAENALLKRHLSNISNQSHKLQQEQRAAEAQIRQLWQSNAQPAQLDQAVENFTELYSDYGKRRAAELSFHLQQLQVLANPTEVTKMGLWTMGQQSLPSSSAKEQEPRKNSNTNRIAGLLQKELDITPQQGKKILEQREKIRNVSANLKNSLRLLGKLQSLCEQKTRIFHDRLSKCREILTPHQVVKLILWIDDHSNVLDQVCPGWGSEQLPNKTTATKTTEATSSQNS